MGFAGVRQFGGLFFGMVLLFFILMTPAFPFKKNQRVDSHFLPVK